jgi:hypothetical protein
MLKYERESAEHYASLKGLACIAEGDIVMKAIRTLHNYAVHVLLPLREIDPNQEFDGFDLAVIYVRTVIREQYAGEFPAAPEMLSVLDSIQTDPLHSTIGEAYALRNTPYHNTTRVLAMLCITLEALMDTDRTDHSRDVAMHLWLSKDKQIHNFVQTWLWRGHTRRGMTQPMGRGDEWLLTKLRDAQRDPDAIKRDYFNMWTTSDENRAIPADVLARATCPEIPNKDKP